MSTSKSITTTSSTASTSTSIPIPSTEICSESNDCDGSSCSLEKARSLQEPEALFKRVMRGPENYGGDVTRFFIKELVNARKSRDLLDYRGHNGVAKLEYFRNRDITTGVLGLFGCTSVIVISRGAVWVSHWWEDPVFMAQSIDEFRKLMLIPLVEGDGNRMPGLGGLTGPTQPFEALYQPRAIIASVKEYDGQDIFEYDGKINLVQLKLKALMPGIRITTYKFGRNKEGALKLSSPLGKILIQYSATEPNCERKYRVWAEAQEQLEESWPAAEGLPNISSGDVNTCMSSSTITSSDYSTSRGGSIITSSDTSRRSSTITSSDYSTSRGGSITSSDYPTSRRSSTITSSDTSRRSSTITSSGYSTSTSTSSSPPEVETTSSTLSTTSSAAPTSTMSSSQTISTMIPAGAAPCPSLGVWNTLPCPDGEDETVAVMGENPKAGGDGFAYNLYSACDTASVTVTLTWSDNTILVKTLDLPPGLNAFDTPGHPEPCLFWSVDAAISIPAGAAACPSLGNYNTLPCPDGEDQEVAVMGKNPVAGGVGFAYNLYSSCDTAPVTVTLTWSDNTILVKTLDLPSVGPNEFDTPGNREPCVFWSVAAA
ncbi:hypothetical protein BGZ57DRAFT_928912 [Hyaloscypha finlandica]|nr:hypothetical protein BGZ57DRAFT_928912 [Hyaloscypha finlandica]